MLLLITRMAAIITAVILIECSTFQLATAIAINAQAPTKANSRMFLYQVINKLIIPATIIIISAQAISERPKRFHLIFVSHAAASATKATVIQPEYKQKGHHTKAIFFNGKSSNSILVAKMILTKETISTIIIITEIPM